MNAHASPQRSGRHRRFAPRHALRAVSISGTAGAVADELDAAICRGLVWQVALTLTCAPMPGGHFLLALFGRALLVWNLLWLAFYLAKRARLISTPLFVLVPVAAFLGSLAYECWRL